ncbi:Oxygen-dependent coproporphyrinogen-III oxidase [Vibrio stylophorae]|uniref:coproporphyrinogen oxidase n=1 Tax=Vibrio stylophorae TaxID=659351 RepID=A0ABM8ZXX8_9VIBR|nr:oxygen-dependent coproporphyrinogen oxidase [Vibrio stylophorae]CAH0535130.1 Oxygen-dependent coproporphyrinogen-III oxidase [Vibrio stylophorae]
MMQTQEIQDYFLQLQQSIVDALAQHEPNHAFIQDRWQSDLGQGISCVLQGGEHFASAGVNFSFVEAAALPAAASQKRPQLAGLPYQAMGVSMVIHPVNPFVPTFHANVRFFIATDPQTGEQHWWFGGGLDLTPYQLIEADVTAFHRACEAACRPFSPTLYQELKANCDRYFYLPHRQEHRGVGGLFFDDFNRWPMAQCFAFVQAVGEAIHQAYLPLIEKRKMMPYDQSHLDFQAFRRSRYVEFNLLFDRGTIFGIQSGGRTASILMSMPPVAHWHYQDLPPKDEAQRALIAAIRQPVDW